MFNPNSIDGWAKGKAFTSKLGCGKENYNEIKNEILQGAIKYPSKFKGRVNSEIFMNKKSYCIVKIINLQMLLSDGKWRMKILG